MRSQSIYDMKVICPDSREYKVSINSENQIVEVHFNGEKVHKEWTGKDFYKFSAFVRWSE